MTRRDFLKTSAASPSRSRRRTSSPNEIVHPLRRRLVQPLAPIRRSPHGPRRLRRSRPRPGCFVRSRLSAQQLSVAGRPRTSPPPSPLHRTRSYGPRSHGTPRGPDHLTAYPGGHARCAPRPSPHRYCRPRRQRQWRTHCPDLPLQISPPRSLASTHQLRRRYRTARPQAFFLSSISPARASSSIASSSPS